MPQLTWSKLIPLTYDEIQRVSDLGGVYRLSYLSADKSYYVFYVGKAESLKKRILNHIGNLEENTCIRSYIKKYPCYFRFAVIAGEHERSGAERQLFLKFSPKCNLQEPDGPLITINFY
jgi:excinuclease UvrABC nuclease subunit